MMSRESSWMLFFTCSLMMIITASSTTPSQHTKDSLDVIERSNVWPDTSSKTNIQSSDVFCGAPPVLKHASVSVSETTVQMNLNGKHSQHFHINTQNDTVDMSGEATELPTIWEHKHLDSHQHLEDESSSADYGVKFQPKHIYNYDLGSYDKEVISMSLDGDNEVIHYSDYSYHDGENKEDGELFASNYDPLEPRVMASKEQMGLYKLLPKDASKPLQEDGMVDSTHSLTIPSHQKKKKRTALLDKKDSANGIKFSAGRVIESRAEAQRPISSDQQFSEGSTVQYTCTSAHHMLRVGEVHGEQPHLVCKNGRWHGRQPKCVLHGCHRPPRLRNGYHMRLDNTGAAHRGLSQHGSRVQVLCHVGFELHGADVLHCQSDGTWTPRHQPRCIPSPALRRSSLCYPPSSVVHATSTVVRGVVTSEGALHGTLVHHTCHHGYRATSQHPCNTTYSTVCDEGSWRGTEPQCEPFEQCLAPPVVHHSVLYESSSEYPLRYRLYYYCQAGYQLQGPSLIQCEAATGCWTPRHHSPRCAPLLGANSDGVIGGVSLPAVDGSTLLLTVTGCLLLLVLAFALLLYHRTLRPKRMRRLHNSLSNTGGDLTAAGGSAGEGGGGGGALPQHATQQHAPLQQSAALAGGAQHLVPGGGSSHPPVPPPQHHSARLLVKHCTDQGLPPSYEESVRVHRPALLEHPPCLSGGRGPRPVRGGGGAGHRVGVTGGRRPRHRDHPDNISYQSIGSARHSAASMRSWSACDSLGSSDTVHAPPPDTVTCSSGGGGGGGSIGGASESTNVTLDTLSSISSATASQAASCRALFGSRTSFDSSSLVTNEGAPLLEEAEGEEGGLGAEGSGRPAPDQISQCTRDSEDGSSGDTRSPAFSLHE